MAATSEAPDPTALHWYGALAQLGERLHGMQEVSGSIPLGSTSFADQEDVRGTASGKTPEAQAKGCWRVEMTSHHAPWSYAADTI